MKKVEKTSDGKRNLKLLPETFTELFNLKVEETWDECIIRIIKKFKERTK